MATSPRSRALLPLLALGIACASAATRPPRDAGAWTVESYRVELAPDFETRSISGVTTLSVVAAADVTEVRVPLGALVVERVTAGEEPLAFAQRDGVLTVALRGARRAAAAELRVEYHGTGAKGLVWGERSIHTTFFACQWMVCDQDRPGERSRLALELVVPDGLDVVASGRELAARPEPGGRVRHVWTQERPYPDYLFGFAVGRFTHVSLDARPPGLDVVAEGETPERLRELFADTARMRAFFEERAGVPLPHRYTQVLVPGAEAQEASSLSFVGRDYVEPVLADPHEDWVIAHELAHQWWGNLVTCASWRHFWLNEGLTTFMVAAYKEARWGRGDYERELELARASHRRAVDAGFDVPLAYADPYPSLRIKRAITYSKGALFLDLLRRTVGERAFWEGIRRYTTSNAGRSVESRDFQRAMEAASEADLSALFAEWVYGA